MSPGQKSIWLFVSIALSIALFFPILNAQFVSDDWDWLAVAHDRSIVLPDLATNYAGTHIGGSYNPVSSAWVNVLYKIFGLSPFAFHAASVILHGVIAWLVGILIFQWLTLVSGDTIEGKKRLRLAVLTGVLFVVWPTHVEAVTWMASVPHLLASAFIVLSLIWYLAWKQQHTKALLIFSLIAGVLAFFSKESSLSLPLIIVALEYWYHRYKCVPVAYNAIVSFFVTAIVFIGARFAATGLLFGSYAETGFIFRPWTWAHTFFTFFEEMLLLGIVRKPWSLAFFSQPLTLTVLACMILGLLAYFVQKKNKHIFFLSTLFILSVLPYIPLGFNRLSQEGERYTYLPSVFFMLLIAQWLSKGTRIAKRLLAIGVLAVSILLVLVKVTSWGYAGIVSEQIIGQFSQFASAPRAGEFVFVALPDTIGGAHVFRNNIAEAIRLTYPSFTRSVVRIPVYTQPLRSQAFASLLHWQADERGYFAYAPSGSSLITGKDREVGDRMTYELWGYRYDRFSSDTVRLIFTDMFKQKLADGSAVLLTWNGGVLQRLSFPKAP